MTQPISFDADTGAQWAWDSTSLSAFEKCPRYYEYKHIQGWQPLLLSVHLRFGGAYATALEHFFKHLALGDDRDTATRKVIHEALISTWDREMPEEDGVPWDSMHNTKTRETLIRSIVWYLDHFEDDATQTVILANGKPAVELSFKLPVEDSIVFCGHLDRLVEYSGGQYVMDQKTTGTTISTKFFSDFTPDIQMSMYTWAGQIIFDIPVKGVIIDAAQIAVGFTRFERGFVHRTKPLLDDWFDSTMATIERARKATLENHFPMNRTACGNYGGCEFRKICSHSPEHRPNFLEADFVKMPRWDPAKSR
tara:strand:+ start:3950 stop:4873 length:924 start_codon:yes stop_codon:yes gene_type:complete